MGFILLRLELHGQPQLIELVAKLVQSPQDLIPLLAQGASFRSEAVRPTMDSVHRASASGETMP